MTQDSDDSAFGASNATPSDASANTDAANAADAPDNGRGKLGPPQRGETIEVEWQECADAPDPGGVARLEAWTAGPGEARRPPRRSLATPSVIAAALIGGGVVFAAGLYFGDARRITALLPAASLNRAVAVAPAPPEPDAGQQIAKMSADLRTLSAGLETMRGRLETVRTNSDTMSASFEAFRLSLDRNRPTDDIRALKKSVEALKSGLDQAKADSAAALGQLAQKFEHGEHDPGAKLAQISDRLDRLDRDQTAKLAQIGERLDRIERRAAAPDVTGSIPHSAAVPVPQPKPVAALIAPPPPVAKPAALLEPQPLPTIPGLVVRDVEGGAALIEGRGGLFEIGMGDFIPGVGKVESIERRGRDWVVVTNRGIIESAHH